MSCGIQAEQVLFLYSVVVSTCIGSIASALPAAQQAGSHCDAASGYIHSRVVFYICREMFYTCTVV